MTASMNAPLGIVVPFPTADGSLVDAPSQSTAARPTEQTYDELTTAYNHFNARLFDGNLPPCLITLQRHKRARGYFSPTRFIRRGDLATTDEIAMNPLYFAARPIRDTLSTLVHEMVHLWQMHYGRPGRGRYHNEEWADRMDLIGLCASATGEPGGPRTGDHMTHYIVDGGAFDQACQELLTTEFTLSWMDRMAIIPADPAAVATLAKLGLLGTEGPKKKGATRTKYRCPGCKVQVWGKPELSLRCGTCDDSPAFLPVT